MTNRTPTYTRVVSIALSLTLLSTIAISFADANKDSQMSPIEIAEAFRDQALNFWQAGAKDKAIGILDNAITQFPNDWENYSMRGEWLGELKRYDAAIVDLRRVTELVPYIGEKWGQLGWYLILQGHFSDAQAASAKAQALAPDVANWAVNLGHTYLLQGDRKTAHVWYQKSIPLIPDEDVLKNSVLAGFDLFVARGWQAVASKEEGAWYEREANPLAKKSAEANVLFKQAELARQQHEKEKSFNDSQNISDDDREHERKLYDEAESSYKRALAIREKFFGPEHPDVAVICTAMGKLLIDTMGSAITIPPLYQRAFAITEKFFGSDHLATASALDNLAEYYSTSSDHDKTIPLYQRALSIREKILGPKHPNVATTLDTLAHIWDNNQALIHARRALAIREEVLGPNHQETATSLITVADQLMDATLTLIRMESRLQRYLFNKITPTEMTSATNNCLIAEPLYKRALVIREKALGIDKYKASQLRSLAVLTYCYNYLNQDDKIKQLYEHDLASKEQILGAAHNDTIASMELLADFYQRQGQYTKTEQLLQRAIDAREKALEPQHTVASIQKLAEFYHDRKQYDKEEVLLQRAMNITEQALGPHIDTIANIQKLVEFYYDHKQYAKEEIQLQHAATLIEQVPGIKAHDIIFRNERLTEFYHARGQYSKEEQYLQHAKDISEKMLGPCYEYEHSAYGLGVIGKLAAFYEQQHQNAKQEQLWQHSLATMELGATQDCAIMVARKLADFYLKSGQYAKAEPLVQRILINAEKAITALDLSKEENFGAVGNELSLILEIAQDYISAGREDEMDKLAHRIVDISENFLSIVSYRASSVNMINDPQRIYSFLTIEYEKSGRYDMLDKFNAHILATRKKNLGSRHEQTLDAVKRLISGYISHAESITGIASSMVLFSPWGDKVKEPIGHKTLSATEKQEQSRLYYDKASQLYEEFFDFKTDKEFNDNIDLGIKIYEGLGLCATRSCMFKNC